MKNGNLQDSAEVVRDLLRRNKERTLNASEKQMLDNARKWWSVKLHSYKMFLNIKQQNFFKIQLITKFKIAGRYFFITHAQLETMDITSFHHLQIA